MTSTRSRWTFGTVVLLAGLAGTAAPPAAASEPVVGACVHAKPPKHGSEEWFEIEAQRPVGAPQVAKYGKLWPPFPRPVGKKQHWVHRYHAAHYWPWPYNCADQAYVREVMQQQIESGWIAATTLYDYHFDIDTQLLNHAGELHLRWILESAPMGHRVAFVQTCADAATSQARLSNVRNGAVAMVGEENAPPVILRVASPAGRPALEINRIRQGEIESMPVPRIQYTPLPNGGGPAR